MSRPEIEPGPPALKASTLEKSHPDGYSEHLHMSPRQYRKIPVRASTHDNIDQINTKELINATEFSQDVMGMIHIGMVC
jgi:hypothetical protein